MKYVDTICFNVHFTFIRGYYIQEITTSKNDDIPGYFSTKYMYDKINANVCKFVRRLALDLGGNLYAVPRPGRNHTKDQADSHDRSYAPGCTSIITFAKNPKYSFSFSQPSTGHDSTKSEDCSLTQVSYLGGAQWLSWENTRLGIK